MIGEILEVLSTIKNKKIKKKEQELKKKEKERAKELVKEGKDYGTAHKEVSTDKELAKEKKALKQQKIAALIRKIITWIVKVIEMVINFFAVLFGSTFLIVILIVAIVVTLLCNFIPIIGDDDFVPPMNQVEAPSQGGGKVSEGEEDLSKYATGEWSETELATRGILLSDYEKNLYRMTMLYKKLVDGTYGYDFWGKPSVKAMNERERMAYLLGFSAIESGMKFYVNKPASTSILKYGSDISANSSGYAFLGLHWQATLTKYRGNNLGIPEKTVKAIEDAWKPAETPKYTVNFVPYATAIQSKFLEGVLATVNTYKDLDKDLDEAMKAYGITANRDKLKSFVVSFLSATGYHGSTKEEYRGYISFWCAVWASTSSVDAERSFDKIMTTKNVTNYAESTLRKAFLSYHYGGKDVQALNLGRTLDKAYFKINGVDTKLSIMGYAYEHCGNKAYFNSTVVPTHNKFLTYTSGARDRVLNFHYGLLAYIHGQGIMRDLESKLVPLDSYKGYKETKGKGQGLWDGMTIDKFLNSDSKYLTVKGQISVAKKFQPYWGTSWDLKLGSSSPMYEWRKKDAWGVPFYYQSNSGDTYPLNIGDVVFSGSGLNGCAFYMCSYIASALTGKMINPAEMASGLVVTGGETPGGGFTNDSASNTFAALGIKFGQYKKNDTAGNKRTLDRIGLKEKSTNYWNDRWSYIDEVLEMGGIVGVSVNGDSVFTSGGHYMCITGKDKKTGKYNVYTSSRKDQTKTLYGREYFADNLLRTGGFYFAIKK